MPFCPRCGKEVGPETQFCPNCGFALNAIIAATKPTQAVLPTASQPKRSIIRVVLGGVTGIIILLVGLVLFLLGLVALFSKFSAILSIPLLILSIFLFVVGFFLARWGFQKRVKE